MTKLSYLVKKMKHRGKIQTDLMLWKVKFISLLLIKIISEMC